MRKIVVTVIIFGFVLLVSAKETETIDQLKARAAAAEQKKQAELYSQLAKMQLEAANNVYEAHADEARNLIAESADSAEKAATASMESKKREKKTEIDLRELAKRMDDIGKTWAFDDRAPVKAAIQRVENVRSKLLDRMFQK